MGYIRKLMLFGVLVGFLVNSLFAQEDKIYGTMSLDEILNIDVVVTASKQPEDLFETPLSVTIIKKEDIEKSGATSIPEALRLSPGLIVREITPGNYDVHIRGYDDITKNVYITLPYNTTTLVMIDNRVVYNYFSGGTMWESFPIDINDVEQIEVVRGPASALYGPNAVTGVINIITKRPNKRGLNLMANGIVGSNQAKNFSTNIGYNFNDKTKLSFSGNITERNRFDSDYYNLNTNAYTSVDDLQLVLPILKEKNTMNFWSFKEYQERVGAYYDIDASLRRMGGNIFLNHAFSEKANFDLAFGTQQSQCQKTGFLNMVTPISETKAKSFYVNTRINYGSFSGQLDIYRGEDNSNFKFNSFRFTNIDANIEYFKQLNKFSVRPGISYREARVNSPMIYEQPINLSELMFVFKDKPRITNTISASLLSEWRPTPRLRVIGATRVDKIDINKNYSFNYEIASTYRVNKNNLIRAVHARATRSNFIIDSYLNCDAYLNIEQSLGEGNPLKLNVPSDFNIIGGKDLKYPTITNQEFSWRTKLKPKIDLDFEVFYSFVRNFVNANAYRTTELFFSVDESGKADEKPMRVEANGKVIMQNHDLKASQIGASVSATYTPSDKLALRLYGTVQNTTITGNTSNVPALTKVGTTSDPNIAVVEMKTFLNPTRWSAKVTPSLYGGFTGNLKLTDKWSLNSDAYFFSNQVFVGYDYPALLTQDGGAGKEFKTLTNIKPNVVFNGKASYSLSDRTNVFLSVKNIFGKHYEYGFADQIGTQFLFGLKWELK
jgi:iron complex outermembrane recepter protein